MVPLLIATNIFVAIRDTWSASMAVVFQFHNSASTDSDYVNNLCRIYDSRKCLPMEEKNVRILHLIAGILLSRYRVGYLVGLAVNLQLMHLDLLNEKVFSSSRLLQLRLRLPLKFLCRS